MSKSRITPAETAAAEANAATLNALGVDAWHTVAELGWGGVLEARGLTKGVGFYWRGKDGGKWKRERLGMYDSHLPHNKLEPTHDNRLSVPAAIRLAEARSSAATQAAQAGTSLATLKAQRQRADKAEAERAAAEQAAAERQKLIDTLPAMEAWTKYLKERKPHWGERHYADHVGMASPGGVETKRGTRGRGVTEPGPLHALLKLNLSELTTDKVNRWAANEATVRKTRARLALRHLRAFLVWCSEHSTYGQIVTDASAAKGKKAREALGNPQAKDDALLREQLPAWFKAVQALPDATAASYLQAMLLTGARPGELLALKWTDINWQWRGTKLHDKATQADREIPLTPYVSHLLSALPRRGKYVFGGVKDGDKPMARPHRFLARACAVAGIEGLTLHGLRRSFGSLSEWLELPGGAVAQIMGHKPSATAEKHYRVRPLDLLRVQHERYEAWILEQAGVQFDATVEPGKLRAVN